METPTISFSIERKEIDRRDQEIEPRRTLLTRTYRTTSNKNRDKRCRETEGGDSKETPDADRDRSRQEEQKSPGIKDVERQGLF